MYFFYIFLYNKFDNNPSGTTSPLEQRGSTTAIPEELTLDYAEITSIPPLPLWTLLAADKETLKPVGTDENAVSYFSLFLGYLVICLFIIFIHLVIKKYYSTFNCKTSFSAEEQYSCMYFLGSPKCSIKYE